MSEEKKPEASSPDVDTPAGLVKVAAGGLFFYGAALFASGLLAAYGLVALVAKAMLAEIGLSRLGVRWAFDEEGSPSFGVLGRGFGAGLAAACIVALLVVVTKAGHLEPGGLVVTTLATGMLSASATAVFEELFLRGLVLRLTSHVDRPSIRIGACALAQLAVALAEPGSTVLEAAVVATLGAAFAASWLRERSAYEAMAAHAGWLFGSRALFRGGLFELAGSKSLLGGLGAGPFAGALAWVVAAGAFVAALVALRRTQLAGAPTKA